MLRERKGGCPWCSPGGSCHHRQRAALAAHYTRPILPAAFCKMGAVAAATAPQVCGERGSEAHSPCRHAAWLSLSAASGKAEGRRAGRSEEHTSELQSLMRISDAVFCLKKKKKQHKTSHEEGRKYLNILLQKKKNQHFDTQNNTNSRQDTGITKKQHIK